MKNFNIILFVISLLSSAITIVSYLNEFISLIQVVIIILIIGVIVIIISGSKRRYFNHKVKGRENVIKFGNSLINDAHDEVVMFGKDLSWANDYIKSIINLIERNKKVSIYYVSSKNHTAKKNVSILKKSGAILTPLKFDLGLRGTLIDPNDGNGTCLYNAFRVKKTLLVGTYGVSGNDNDYSYRGIVYHSKRDYSSLLNVYVKIYQNIDLLVDKQ